MICNVSCMGYSPSRKEKSDPGRGNYNSINRWENGYGRPLHETFLQSRDWSRFIKLFRGLTFYERFEQAVILTLIALIMLVTAIATIHLIGAVWHLVVDVGIDPINQTVFQAIFGAIFTVIIALEFKHSLLVVLAQHENVIRVRTIVLIALLAIARKFILLDLHDVTAMELFALSAAVLALGVVYWLVREQDARVARDAREQAHLEDNSAARCEPERSSS